MTHPLHAHDRDICTRAAARIGLEIKPARYDWWFTPDVPGGPVGRLWHPIANVESCHRLCLAVPGFTFDAGKLTSVDYRRALVELIAGPKPEPVEEEFIL